MIGELLEIKETVSATKYKKNWLLGLIVQEYIPPNQHADVLFAAGSTFRVHDQDVDSQILTRLLENGVDFHAVDKYGNTFLQRLLNITNGRIHEIIPIADIIQAISTCRGLRGYDPALIELLDHQNKDGTTLLMSAVPDEPELVRLLLTMGVNPSLKDNKGYTALDKAIARHYPELIILLSNAQKKDSNIAKVPVSHFRLYQLEKKQIQLEPLQLDILESLVKGYFNMLPHPKFVPSQTTSKQLLFNAYPKSNLLNYLHTLQTKRMNATQLAELLTSLENEAKEEVLSNLIKDIRARFNLPSLRSLEFK